jgi:hypothetical protein
MAFRNLILSGARARLSIDGVKVALCMNVAYGEEIEHQPVEPLDQFDVAEFVPIAYRCSFSCQMMRIITNTIKNRDGIVIFPTLANILTRGEMTATIEDNQTGTIIANIQRVKCSGYNNNVGARGIVMKDCQFNAIRVVNESELAG